MYKEYWGLAEKPFENTPDPKFLYLSEQHEEALSRLLYGLEAGKGAMMLSGIFGCGKTFVAKALFKKLDEDVFKVAYVANPVMDNVDLLRFVLHKLESPSMPERKADVLVAITNILTNNHSDGRRTVVTIDEAHAIKDPTVFEEIRLLLNFQVESQFLVNVLLLGQPELVLSIDSIKQLAQRIDIRYNLGPLSMEEAEGYIQHRLRIAGGRDGIFTSEAMKMVYQHSGGIPRRINQICDMSLLAGFFKRATLIEADVVEDALGSFSR